MKESRVLEQAVIPDGVTVYEAPVATSSVKRKHSPVKVPAGAGGEFSVLIFVHENAAGVTQFMVCHHLKDYPVIYEGIHIQILCIAVFRVLEVTAIEGVGNGGDIAFDISLPFLGEFRGLFRVRMLHGKRNVMVFPLENIVIVEIKFK